MVLILLPPSEAKSRPRRGQTLDLSRLSFPTLTAARERIIDALVQTCQLPDAADILGLGARLIGEVDHNAELRAAPTRRDRRVEVPFCGNARRRGGGPP